ncbi:TetR/AcrR family transcriptional regulator [Mycetocola reblochoni]|uniref:Transcriptional regulator, TetR family n=2 Tax=Mycetocola reblochoni TaxID=331618 RepID=A0A1R4KDK4_9MICO|nr:TetR/AcrR family transcriptional regulator [Mycetocola reblochoni]RLP69006.1 TetR/AcrR family transcriptional regulator [Mycetocola reblochoni]SJN42357.1 Transcriptional regulator, TetR family [Mycetocola reblochoni REB411]
MSVPGAEPVVESARRQRTRERLLDAALELFAEQGLRAASVEAIAERAGFTRGAFYSNFDGKESLMFALADREHRVAMDALHEALTEMLPRMKQERDASPGSVFPWSYDSIMELLERILDPRGDDRNSCLLQSEFVNSALRDPAFAPRFSDYESRVIRELSSLVSQALAEVGLRFTVTPDYVLRTLVDIYEAAARIDVMREVAVEPAEPERREVTIGAIVAVVEAFIEPIPAGTAVGETPDTPGTAADTDGRAG